MSERNLGPKGSSRRKFLRTVAGGGLRLFVPTLALSAAAFEPVPAIKKPDADPDLIYPGSLEDRSEASHFIDPVEKGYFPLVKDIVLNNPDIAGSLKDVFDHARKIRTEENRSPGFGELLLHAYKHESSVIAAAKIRSDVNPNLEAAHRAAYVLTAFSTLAWFSLKELKTLGLADQNIDPKTHVTEVVWGENGLGTTLYSRFFGTRGAYDNPGDEPAEKGNEREMHVAGHFLLGFLNHYFDQIKHPYKGAVPNFIRAGINIGYVTGAIDSLSKETHLLSKTLGYGYELKGSFSKAGLGAPLLGIPPREGIPDKNFENDMKANRLGIRLGEMFYHLASERKDLSDFTRMIDSPRYKRKESEPEPRIPGGK